MYIIKILGVCFLFLYHSSISASLQFSIFRCGGLAGNADLVVLEEIGQKYCVRVSALYQKKEGGKRNLSGYIYLKIRTMNAEYIKKPTLVVFQDDGFFRTEIFEDSCGKFDFWGMFQAAEKNRESLCLPELDIRFFSSGQPAMLQRDITHFFQCRYKLNFSYSTDTSVLSDSQQELACGSPFFFSSPCIKNMIVACDSNEIILTLLECYQDNDRELLSRKKIIKGGTLYRKDSTMTGRHIAILDRRRLFFIPVDIVDNFSGQGFYERLSRNQTPAMYGFESTRSGLHSFFYQGCGGSMRRSRSLSSVSRYDAGNSQALDSVSLCASTSGRLVMDMAVANPGILRTISKMSSEDAENLGRNMQKIEAIGGGAVYSEKEGDSLEGSCPSSGLMTASDGCKNTESLIVTPLAVMPKESVTREEGLASCVWKHHGSQAQTLSSQKLIVFTETHKKSHVSTCDQCQIRKFVLMPRGRPEMSALSLSETSEGLITKSIGFTDGGEKKEIKYSIGDQEVYDLLTLINKAPDKVVENISCILPNVFSEPATISHAELKSDEWIILLKMHNKGMWSALLNSKQILSLGEGCPVEITLKMQMSQSECVSYSIGDCLSASLLSDNVAYPARIRLSDSTEHYVSWLRSREKGIGNERVASYQVTTSPFFPASVRDTFRVTYFLNEQNRIVGFTRYANKVGSFMSSTRSYTEYGCFSAVDECIRYGVFDKEKKYIIPECGSIVSPSTLSMSVKKPTSLYITGQELKWFCESSSQNEKASRTRDSMLKVSVERPDVVDKDAGKNIVAFELLNSLPELLFIEETVTAL